MNISVIKAFDKALLPDKIRGDVERFVDFVNQGVDQLSRALFKQLTLTDNFRGKMITVEARHGETLTIEKGSEALEAILVLRELAGSEARLVSSVETGAGLVELSFRFSVPLPIKTRSVTVSSPFATYEAKHTSKISPGDMVSITGFGHAANNGEFPILSVNQTTITCLNENALAQTKATFSGDEEASRSVKLFLLYT